MNKKILHITYGWIVFCLASALAGCGQEENLVAPSGLRIALQEFQQDVHTRAVPADLEKPLAEQFNLKITASGSDRLVHEGKVTSELIPLDAGTYTVTAAYGMKERLGLDAPAYEGSTSVELANGQEKKVQLTCKVANALVSVKMDNPELFNSKYSEYRLVLRNQEGAIKTGNFAKSIYFPANTAFSLSVEGKLTESGSIFNKPLTHENIPATCTPGQHLILTLSMANIGDAPAISKVEVRTEEITATIPVEWLPKPKIQSETGFVDNALNFAETETKEAKLKFITASPLQDMKLKFHFADAAFASYNETEYLLSNPDHKSQLEALGLVLPTIGAATASLDLQALTTQLQTLDGATTANTVEVDVKANNRWSSEDAQANRTYTLNCNKPEFTVHALPGDIWTKEFTLSPLAETDVTAGNFATISQSVTYQFSTDQVEWHDFDPSMTKNGLTENTVYYARAIYRGSVPSNVAEIKTYAADHSLDTGLENWSQDAKRHKLWYVNSAQTDKVEGWCTLNGKTTQDNSPLAYVCNSGTRSTSSKHSGTLAAEIRTLGWGIGTTANKLGGFKVKHIDPGQLFLGKMNPNNTPSYGYSNFTSRPTAIQFYYKYSPIASRKFTVEIALYAGNEQVAYNTFSGGAQNEYIEKKVEFVYDPSKKSLAIDRIDIRFNSGDNTKEELKRGSIYGDDPHTGNHLYIDDITLVYDK